VSATRGALRLGRSAVLGAGCLLLALSAHVLAGGPAPSVLAVIVLAVPVTCSCVLVTGRQAGLGRIGTVLGLTQVGLHQGFMALAHPDCAGTTASLPAHLAGHAAGGAGVPASCGPAMQMAGGSAAMVAGHVLAAGITALLLWQGERLLWALLAGLGWSGLPGAEATIPARARVLGAPVAGRGSRSIALLGGVGRRGPPVAVPA
jgi:hypothetical protein